MWVDGDEPDLADYDPSDPCLEVFTRTSVSSLTWTSGLYAVEVLRIVQVGLMSLDGVSALPRLRELYASFNLVKDLDPLWGMDSLEILDIEGNQVSDSGNLMVLESLTSLRVIDVLGNPLVGADMAWAQSRFSHMQVFNNDDMKSFRTVSRASTASSACDLGITTLVSNCQRPLTPRPPTLQESIPSSCAGNPSIISFPLIVNAGNAPRRTTGPVRALPLIKR